ncbi:MAG: DUF2158 domain-containing protein [Silvibacterium sp.]
MAEDLKDGDIVQLKSGGPKMTVANIGIYGMGSTKKKANCVWFEGSKKQESLFELHSLEKV